ncbi:hypothetical protein EJB05_43055, partial [Eragrostis curvula]
MRGAMAVKPAAILLLLYLAFSLDIASAADERAADFARRQVLRQERATLLALKRGLTLPSPSALADWNESNGHVCGFTGVACDRRREHVVGLALANMSISGAIPAVIGDLARLRSLDMSNNSISGGMPSSLGNLTRLESLVLSSNRISGAVPLALGNLLRLENLDVSSNLISGAAPAVLGGLSQLRSLYMSNNNISGAIPPSFGNLTLLENLYMYGNRISGAIPAAIGNLTSLQNLDLSSNLLTGQIPAEISNLRSLATLNLGNNQLRGGIPPTLAKLTGMFYLSLEHNYLSGSIPEAIFLNCTILGVADLGDNDLSGEIPRAAASGTFADTFAVLNLYSNKLTGTLPRWLANCTVLLWLDVENNSLADELPTSIISGKKYLQYLHLSNNRFWSHDGNSNLEPFFAALSNCSSIQEVEAGAVGMGGRLPSRLGSMLSRNMWHLNLEMNSIEGPIPADIGDVINMTLMNLSSNMLNGTIPASLCWLPGLQQLSLSNNSLTGEIPAVHRQRHAPRRAGPVGQRAVREHPEQHREPYPAELPLPADEQVVGGDTGQPRPVRQPDAPRPLEQPVERCKLSICPGTTSPARSSPGIADCVELTVLDLSHNSLAGVLPSSIGGLQSLESLDVSNNSLIGEIPVSLTKCTSLKHLNLSYNDFSGVVPTTGALARFSFLSFLGNRRLCGEVVRRACGRPRHGTWYQSRRFLVILSVSAAGVAFVLTILCAVSIRKIRERLAAVREDMFRGRRGGGARMSDVAISELLELGILCTQEHASARPTMLDAADDLDRLKRYMGGETTATFASSIGFSSVSFEDILID